MALGLTEVTKNQDLHPFGSPGSTNNLDLHPSSGSRLMGSGSEAGSSSLLGPLPARRQAGGDERGNPFKSSGSVVGGSSGLFSLPGEPLSRKAGRN